MKHLNFLIKPASGLCNMRCKYCFYEDETSRRVEGNTGIMPHETANILIREALEAAEDGGTITFAFQGGEPTLAGLDYFRHFVDQVAEENRRRIPIQYTIQTNGLLLDHEWADFLWEHHFLVGLSLDGAAYLHDRLRPDAQGGATWERGLQALGILKTKGVDINLLCVVTRQCAKHPQQVYASLKSIGAGFLQFIPCLDPLDGIRGSMPYSLTPKLYGDFLCGLFDAWYQDWRQGRYTSVRLFDDYVHLAMGMPAGTCATSGSCGAYLVVEGDGTLYPCDFYCVDEWRLGKLGEMPLTELMQGESERRFLAEGEQHPTECSNCPYRRLCYGGCKRDWVRVGGENHNYYCNAFLQFFAYAGERIAEIARAERMQR